MLETTSRVERAVVLIACLWTCSSFDSYGCTDGNHNTAVCEYTENYDEVVTISVKELVHVTKNKWCWSLLLRCPDNKEEFRTVQKNTTVPKTRVIKRCCENHVRLYNNCIPKCTEKQCPNIHCAPHTDKCECKPGYIGHLCRQSCGVGRWGPGCENACHAECSDCDHRTGCCMTAWAVRDVRRNRTTAEMAPLTFCADRTTAAGIATTDGTGTTAETGTTVGTGTPEVAGNSPDGSTAEAPRTTAAVEWDAASSFSTMERWENNGTYEPSVTVYRYDELVMKLVWISAMTAAAIAMVFVIMFVVFFNCDVASGTSDRAKNRRRSTLTSAADPLVYETCIGTHNLGHVTLDRNIKPHGLRTSINNDLPIHPEVFCPVFSAPHHTSYTNTGSSFYDSPQPLYEILF